jgi:hypothetical protein
MAVPPARDKSGLFVRDEATARIATVRRDSKTNPKMFHQPVFVDGDEK